MAGSIAHDFNNLLTIVRGHAQLLQISKTLSGNEREAVDHIVEATRRGAHMTQQMLSLTRKQETAPRVVALNELIETEARLLPRMIGENVEVRFTPAGVPLHVMIDPTQLHQVLANLAINARDAMPNGGTISLVLGSRDNLATIEVRDTGHGIPPDVLPRLFEPFFTTKAPGQGTGLGLPSSHAIITQAGGTIEVETVIGHGTTFRLCLPLVQTQETPGGNPYTTSKIPPRVRVARILVVEDEAPVRDIVNQVLQSAGHEVTTAASGEEALRAMRGAAQPFELLVTDVMMPRMGGRVLTDAARQVHPDIVVLFISGYAPDEKLLSEIGCGVENFLQKPFSINDLLRKVGQVLGA
jgi:CheY-like chemotaxis protein